MKELKFVCENNPRHDTVDADKSNENWRVYLEKCPECGGDTVMPIPTKEDAK